MKKELKQSQDLHKFFNVSDYKEESSVNYDKFVSKLIIKIDNELSNNKYADVYLSKVSTEGQVCLLSLKDRQIDIYVTNAQLVPIFFAYLLVQFDISEITLNSTIDDFNYHQTYTIKNAGAKVIHSLFYKS